MKDAVATMGMVLPDDVSGRDAVHVAVISAVADEELFPGQHVGSVTYGPIASLSEDVTAGCSEHPLGIVDPFLSGRILPGCRFWLFLYPRTITGLRHVWEHPAFSLNEAEALAATVHHRPAEKLASEQWLRDFCAHADCPDYDTVMDAVARVADGETVGRNEEYLHFDEQDAHGGIPPEFWDHVEVVLERRIKGKRAAYFSCACQGAAMSEPVTIKVLFDPGRCNPNLHVYERRKWAEAAIAKETARMAWVQVGRPTLAPPVLVTITVKRPRRMDEDNLRSALTPLVNGLFKQAIVEDDSPDFVRYGELIQQTTQPGEASSVTFEVTSLSEET